MTTADKITTSRILLAPVFYFLFFSSVIPPLPASLLLWLLFIVIEVSDLADGMVARKTATVSSFGKLFDPFADVLARLTYFMCFAASGLMPVWILLFIIYREFSMLFLRMLLVERGVTMAARPGGKTKAVMYMVAGILSLCMKTMQMNGIFLELQPSLMTFSMIAYFASLAMAYGSFVDYAIQARRIFALAAKRK